MRWKPEIPQALRTRFKERSRGSNINIPTQGDIEGRRIALQISIRGDILDMSAFPDLGDSFAIEELAKGFDPRRITLFLDNLTSLSPIVWLAAVENKDVKLTVEIQDRDGTEQKVFEATISAGTIVPMRALFDSAKIAMTSGSSVTVALLEDSGPLKIYRQVRRFRRLLH